MQDPPCYEASELGVHPGLLSIAALTAHPPATTSTHGGGRGGGRAWGNPEKSKADGVGLGNTGRAHALSTGQLLLSPPGGATGKYTQNNRQSGFSREAEN